MSEVVATSFQVLNYSGMLYNKGNTKTPLLSMIGSRRRTTNSVEFAVGQQYQTVGGAQPAISENASLTAPDASVITRTQIKNVTQIFMEAVKVSYGKMSNMGTLSGLNISGQTPNPVNELDFQTAAKIQKLQQDIEYTLVNGVYNKATTDDEINKTRGLFPAITSSALGADGAALRVWTVADMMKMIYEQHGSINGLVLLLDAVSLYQLSADAEQNGLKIITDPPRVIGGIQLQSLMTPLGMVNLMLGEHLPSGSAALINTDVLSIVEQPVPGKGNFFLEKLAQTGAGDKYQLFGQLGFDHGPEWMHAKVTGLSTAFVKPPAGKSVYILNETVPIVDTLPVLGGATLTAPLTDAVETSALTLEWIGLTPTSPTLAYQWQIADAYPGTFANIASATSATYTPITAQVGKYIRCKVTSTGTGTGVVYTNAVVVEAAT